MFLNMQIVNKTLTLLDMSFTDKNNKTATITLFETDFNRN